MKITQVNLYHLRMPLRSPFETSFGRSYTRDCILLEVFSDGLVGWGECVADAEPGYSYETTKTNWHILEDFILPSLADQALDVSSPSPLDGYLAAVAPINGHPMAKAGPEMALWDLLGQASGRSLQHMLGGERAEVSVGVSVMVGVSEMVGVRVMVGVRLWVGLGGK